MTYEQTFLIDKNVPCITELFSKTFRIVTEENYSLPRPDCMFKENPWYIKELQILKEQLNEVKNRLNSFNLGEWHEHTSNRNKAGQVQYRVRRDIKPELVTQAWCKFYEILSFFDVVPQNEIIKNNNSFTSVHLCEAPGAFITSLNHWLKTNTRFNWNWLATSLNPYYEGNSLNKMINDDRFIIHTLNHWCFGKDNTGNLMDLKNLDELVKKAKVNDNILLITADGSIDCMDVPGEQETVVSHLHYCETVAALHLLNEGGSFVIKIFTTFEHSTICLLYLLSCCFYKVFITKPATSKEGNSETYVVCMNFKGSEYIAPYLRTLQKYYECGPSTAIFCRKDIHPDFITKIINCSQFFKEIQTSVIMNNVISFKSNEEIENKIINEIKIIQKLVAEKYLKDCNLKPLPPGCEIVEKDESRNIVFIKAGRKQLYESYDKRREKANKSPVQRLIEYWDLTKEIFNGVSMSKSYNFQFSDEHIILEYCIGKPFYKLFNSRFCNSRILNIQIDLENILDILHLKKFFPSNEDTHNLLQELHTTLNCKILCFQYTDIPCDSKIISRLCQLLQMLVYKDSLVLIGYSLLSRLNVSLLYLLSYTFHSIELQSHDKVGCIIILKNYKNDASILKIWEKINITENALRTEGKTILSLLPVSYLCDWAAYPKIVECNHWIIKKYLNYLINNAMEKINQC
ncbi:cap-specific mRNA (nucleoside-2'-O-)-methyltransferase 2-like isoform X1 [Vespula pensylvanica]|uniref:Cap-specific mRNA (nucleoside-2'-O-)-methyltransferase 2 n=2 Tax=Vespula pensylvanica TaxID=30213 RepID=A0A834NY63_VESPE|nr:cap-specific mRNA (nucleoside-2'-O-)-methyltransferase 2-like isoform X1 [Vespula pensylvanica]KAF7420645.1 hypothetical protein H0235_010942 [Vespula pensylvanica]